MMRTIFTAEYTRRCDYAVYYTDLKMELPRKIARLRIPVTTESDRLHLSKHVGRSTTIDAHTLGFAPGSVAREENDKDMNDTIPR